MKNFEPADQFQGYAQHLLHILMRNPELITSSDLVDFDPNWIGDDLDRRIYLAIEQSLTTSGRVDPITIAKVLDASCVSLPYVTHLLTDVRASAANLSSFAQHIRRGGLIRQASSILADAQHALGRPEAELEAVVADLQTNLISMADVRQGETIMGVLDVTTRLIEEIESKYESDAEFSGLRTGFEDLDKLTQGLFPGDLVIVAARPAMGKTTFALNIAAHAAEHPRVGSNDKKHVLVLTQEMPNVQLAAKLVSSFGGPDVTTMRSGKLKGDDWSRLTHATGRMSRLPMLLDETPALTLQKVLARIRRAHRRYGLGLVVIDYLQLMVGDNANANRNAQIEEITRALKSEAKLLGIPIILLSQLNRELERRANKRPMMSDLRESGAIEQDADTIMFIYRDEIYNPDSPQRGGAEVIIGKQRNGPTGTIFLAFNGAQSRFNNWSGAIPEATPVTSASAGGHYSQF